uniref:Uncharacterized protein n=1 Tax=Cucumis melo TaxID=3656 RepID=A0A9I9DRL0_CUCME
MAGGRWIEEDRRCDVNYSTKQLSDFINRDRFGRWMRRCATVVTGLRRTKHGEKTGIHSRPMNTASTMHSDPS